MSKMQACMDSLAEQNAILKVRVSCPREMPLQFNCCMPGCTKNVRSKGPLQLPRRFQDAKLTLTLKFLQTHSKLTDISFNGFIESSACVHKIVFYGAR